MQIYCTLGSNLFWALSCAHLVNQRLVFINENKPPNIPHQLIDYLHFRYLSFHSLLLIALLVTVIGLKLKLTAPNMTQLTLLMISLSIILGLLNICFLF